MVWCDWCGDPSGVRAGKAAEALDTNARMNAFGVPMTKEEQDAEEAEEAKEAADLSAAFFGAQDEADPTIKRDSQIMSG